MIKDYVRNYKLFIISGYFIILLAVAILHNACTSESACNQELADIDRRCADAMESGHYAVTDSLADILLLLSQKHESDSYLRKAYFYKGNYIPENDSSAIKRCEQKLDTAEYMASKAHDVKLLAQIYNIRGVWEIERQNYQTAQYYFKRGLQFARESNYEKAIAGLESNFSEVSRLLGDTLGMAYDREIFKRAMKKGNQRMRRSAAFHCSRYYLRPGGDTVALKKYIDVMAIDDTLSGIVPMVYARYWLANNDYEKAYSYIRKSKYNDFHEATLTYAEILNRIGEYEESNEYVKALLDLYGQNYSGNQWSTLYKLSAQNLKGLGKYAEAYDAMSKYADYSDSLYNQKLGDLTKRYMVEFGTEKLSMKVTSQKEHIMWLWILSGALVVILLLIIGGGTIYYRKRDKLYRSIVAQYMESREREQILESQLKAAETFIQEETKKDLASENKTDCDQLVQGNKNITDAKVEEIWNRIQYETINNAVWQDPQLSRDSFSGILGCSHTYLSEVIRRKTGLPYSGYINSLRIREAKKILSDPNQADVPLKEVASKTGFSSLSNFYTLFKQECGMPPAAFRKTALSMTNSEVSD